MDPELPATNVERNPNGHIEPGDEQPFRYVVSLGLFCLTASVCKLMKLRKFSCPFDWCFSNAVMLKFCLADQFLSFKNEKLFKLEESDKGKRTGHQIFSHMLKRKVVFNHHDPVTNEKDRFYFGRCIERLRMVLNSKERKMFLIIAPNKRKCENDFSSLFAELCKHTSNFQLTVIHLFSDCKDEEPSYKKINVQQGKGCEDGQLVEWELRCVGGNTGIVFKKTEDAEAFVKIVMSSGQYALLEDPSKVAKDEEEAVRKGIYGDLEEATDEEAENKRKYVPRERRKRRKKTEENDYSPSRADATGSKDETQPDATGSLAEIPEKPRPQDPKLHTETAIAERNGDRNIVHLEPRSTSRPQFTPLCLTTQVLAPLGNDETDGQNDEFDTGLEENVESDPIIDKYLKELESRNWNICPAELQLQLLQLINDYELAQKLQNGEELPETENTLKSDDEMRRQERHNCKTIMEDNIRKIQEMGFTTAKAKQALAMNDGNMEEAVMWLLEQAGS